MARKKLQGQVAIVTGSGRGIGAATARRLALAGANVVLTARTDEEIEVVAAQIKQAQIKQGGGQAIAVAADVSDRTQVEEVIESAIDQFGRVDILINNAGVLWPIDEVINVDPDEWAYNIHVNLIAPFYLINNVLPLMKQQKYGRIVNVSSSSSRAVVTGVSSYLAAKAGLDVFTAIVAKEISADPITINTLYPGHVDTAMQMDLRSVDTTDSILDFSKWQALYEQGALSDPAAVAEALLWLVGPWSRTLSGATFDFNDQNWRAQVRQDLLAT